MILSENEQEEYEERAAIMEHEGGLIREQAEREAMRIIIEKRDNKPLQTVNMDVHFNHNETPYPH